MSPLLVLDWLLVGFAAAALAGTGALCLAVAVIFLREAANDEG